jgi:hypothetical protein
VIPKAAIHGHGILVPEVLNDHVKQSGASDDLSDFLYDPAAERLSWQ